MPKREGLPSSRRFRGRQAMALARRRRSVRMTWSESTRVQEWTRRVLKLSSIYISDLENRQAGMTEML